MTESRALILTYALLVACVSVAYVGLTLANASENALVAVVFVIVSLGAHIISRVVMHYAPPDERGR